MAKNFDVSLLIRSRKLSLSELSSRLEREPQSGSHDKGSPRGSVTWEYTFWRENACDADSSLYAQCSQLLRDIPPKCIELLVAEPDDISVWLDVALFYEGAYCEFDLPRKLIGELFASGVDFSITAYPCSADDSDLDDRKGNEPVLKQNN